MMNAEEYLARVADLVEHGLWTQHAAFGDGVTTPICLAGAVSLVARTTQAWLVKPRAQAALLAEIGPSPDPIEHDPYVRLGWWNDADGRTAVEVATMVRNAKRWIA